jgi:hypothetical protein
MIQNIQSILNKVTKLEVVCKENNVDILLITEHWQENDKIDKEYQTLF